MSDIVVRSLKYTSRTARSGSRMRRGTPSTPSGSGCPKCLSSLIPIKLLVESLGIFLTEEREGQKVRLNGKFEGDRHDDGGLKSLHIGQLRHTGFILSYEPNSSFHVLRLTDFQERPNSGLGNFRVLDGTRHGLVLPHASRSLAPW